MNIPVPFSARFNSIPKISLFLLHQKRKVYGVIELKKNYYIANSAKKKKIVPSGVNNRIRVIRFDVTCRSLRASLRTMEF